MTSEFESPLDFGEDDLPDEPSESKEALLSSYMSQLGFRPKTPLVRGTLEYYKCYADPNGKVARVVAVIEKDSVGLEPKAPDFFTVTIQVHIGPTDEDVEKKAPAFAKADLLRILAHFNTSSEDKSSDVFECSMCGMRVADMTAHKGESVCLDCASRKGIV